METLSYKIGSTWTEVSLTSLGAGAPFRIQFGTHGESKVTLPFPTLPPETAIAIPFESPCILYTGRTGTGPYTGGTILFQGRRTDNSGTAGPSGANQQLVIEDAWYDLRFTTLQAAWVNITGYSGSTPTYGTPYTSPDCVLFQASNDGQLQPDGTFTTYSPLPVNSHITTGQAIEEMLAYAIHFAGVNLQIGQIDPADYVPFYPMRSRRVADAIIIALRPHPACMCEIDYTTTPPTFNIRQQSNLTAITLPYKSTSGGKTHLTSSIRPRPDLQPPRVAIWIKEESTINNQTVVSQGSDIYPTGAPMSLRSLDVSVDMTGPKISKTYATLTAAAFNPASLAWWEDKVPALMSAASGGQTSLLAQLDSTINGGIGSHPKGIQVVDNSGNPIDLSIYACELLAGTPTSWMGVSWIEANVIAFFSYTKSTMSGATALVDQIGEHMHTCRVKLIQMAAGSTTFWMQQVLSTGEVYPTGLAQQIYAELAILQYNLTHTILESPFATIIKPGKHALNLSGGAAAWSTMKAMIQSVDMEFYSTDNVLTASKTTIKCGPVEHLEAGQLVQIFNLFTNRNLSQINPDERTNGVSLGGGQVGLGNDSPKENSVPAQSVPTIQNIAGADATSGNTNLLALDSTQGRLILQQCNASTGANINTGIIPPNFSGAGAPSSTTLPSGSNYRVGDWYVNTSAAGLYRCTTAGTNSTSAWTQISGGGSLTHLRVKDDLGDCLMCHSWDGTTEGTTAVYVAKAPELQNTIGNYTQNGVTYGCTYTLTADTGSSGMHYLSRLLTGSGTSETDDIDPPYLLNTEIYALAIPTITLSQACSLMDVNVLGRCWSAR